MKKLLIISLVMVLILTGCNQKTVVIPDNNEFALETLDVVVSNSDETPLDLSDKDIESVWQEAYFHTLCEKYPSDSERIGLTAVHIKLYDLDLDGIPEMLLSYLGTVNSVIFHGYSYQNGQVVDIELPENAIPPELLLFKDKTNGELIWIAEASFRTSSGWIHFSELIDFTDFSKVSKKKIFEYKEEFILNMENHSRYKMLVPNGNSIELSLNEIEEKRKKTFDKYEKIDVQYLFSFVDVFLKNEKTFLSPEALEHDLFISFLNEWTE